MRPDARIGPVRARAYTIPTDAPEADGTFAWTSTTLVVAEAEGGGQTGLGYTYTSGTITGLIAGKLAEAVSGGDTMDPPRAWRAMQRAVRNMGRDGLAATAISAVDAALWDLKAKLLDLPLTRAYDTDAVRRMLDSRAVDVQQANVSRCGGVTGFLQAAALCEAHHVDLSGHCAPALHLHAACAAPRFRHLERFHDHVPIEHMLFEGAPVPRHGEIRPDLTRPGLGLAFKQQYAT